jgi:hypothetical protein
VYFIEFPRKDFRGARKAQLDLQRALEREGLLRMSSEPGAVPAKARRDRARRRGVGRAATRRRTT